MMELPHCTERIPGIEADEANSNTVLLIEPFYGGSHKQLLDLLNREILGCVTYTLPAKKWHWRARTSALHFSQTIPRSHGYRVLFASSVLNLAELVALRRDLAGLKKVLYFHENQLIYPVRKQQERDFQYGYNQILSCLVADIVLFNSVYNMESFLKSIDTFLKLIPDHRPRNLVRDIQPKCKVLYFPIKFPVIGTDVHTSNPESENRKLDGEKEGMSSSEHTLHIVWAHRWEHDKGPEIFFDTMYKLADSGVQFKLSVLGETFTDVPDIFAEAKGKLEAYIIDWGYQESKEDFYRILKAADVAVSTAEHEFFGVSMLEAVHCQCYPLCPNKLVYPEILPDECLYRTPQQLFKRLREFCRHPHLVQKKSLKIDIEKYSWNQLKPQYMEILQNGSTCS
ncbi:tRNA-queuosine alpha-mannosyltransferase-like [Ptychodera flava]|uniref:tRNA-queuosine alpha-mannosyltransferase-like n=1 Tax=Ptychodera flava TaxID=63121 RepID=UPI00396A4AA2